jgi:HSP20 family protein
MAIRDLIPRRRREGAVEPTRGEHPISALHREMNRLFQDFFGDWDIWPLERLRGRAGAFTPSVDVRESDKDIRVWVDLPGLSEDDIDVELTDDGLTIRGEKKSEQEERGEGVHRVERSYGSFERFVALPTAVEGEKATAEFKNGVLTITLPKPPEVEAKRKKIEIKRD